MKLVKQEILVYQVGQKQKVYEVDLCETAPDQFVVNFRYGRRGGVLKDGSKTVVAVPRGEAEQAYEKLVTAKLEQGYVREAEAGAAPPPAAAPAPAQVAAPVRVAVPVARPAAASRGGAPSSNADRERAVLARLSKSESIVRPLTRRIFGGRRSGNGGWPLSRAIWRAGELQLTAAVPRLLELLGRGDEIQTYSTLWALGRIGDARALDAVREFASTPQAANVSRIANEALRLLVGDGGLPAYVEAERQKLPDELRRLSQAGPAEALAGAVATHVQSGGRTEAEILERLYRIDDEVSRPALLVILAEAPLRPSYFRAMRHIFKAAELRLDAEVFGLVAYRFETSRAMYRSSEFGAWGRLEDGQHIRITSSELAKPNARFAYGTATRSYLRRRAWRTLRRLGELGDAAAYVKMAVGMLLPFSDDDARPGRAGPYDGTWAFNHILYRNSPEREPHPNLLRFRSRRGRPVGRDLSRTRTEAFPQLWAEMPAGLLHLLDESRCEPVHRFAVTALRDMPQVTAGFDRDIICMLLARPYETTSELGVELAEARYDPANPDATLVLAVAACALEAGRKEAWAWIEAGRSTLMRDASFIAELVASRAADTREFAHNLLRGAVLEDQTMRALVVRLVALLFALDESEEERASDVAAVLQQRCTAQLRDVGVEVIRDLLRLPFEAAQVLAGDILAGHVTLASAPPEDILVALIDSPHTAVRASGLRVLAAMPVGKLRPHATLIVAMSCHSEATLRDGARQVILNIARQDSDLAEDIAVELVSALIKAKLPDGAGANLVAVVRDDLSAALAGAPVEIIWKLLESKNQAAHELGGALLGRQVNAADVPLDEMAKLADHPVLSVREAAWRFMRDSLERLKAEPASLARVLDASWDDSRQTAMKMLREEFATQELQPSLLVAICDSVRPDVEQFGRAFVTERFKKEHGVELMLKLAEHPSISMQLFVTNYLEEFAAGHAKRLAALAPYFTGVLSRVNKGGVAKRRAYAFLASEATRDRESAELVAEIVTRASATIAIEDKGLALSIMVAIQRAHPEVEMAPLVLEPLEVRRAV